MYECREDMFKGSGRTTAMLRAAYDLVREGREVFVLTHRSENLVAMFMEMYPASYFKDASGKYIRVIDDGDFTSSGGRLSFVSPVNSSVLYTGRLEGRNPKSPVLMDHHVLETEMPWAWSQWLRWTTEAVTWGRGGDMKTSDWLDGLIGKLVEIHEPDMHFMGTLIAWGENAIVLRFGDGKEMLLMMHDSLHIEPYEKKGGSDE